MTLIRKAVIPAAGLGTRLLPLTRAVPKEMLPLGRKPTLQHIVEELQQAGLAEVLIVTRPDKPAIQTHFADAPGVHFIQQPEPLGLGHAVSLARERVGAEGCLVALADTPLGGPRAGALVPGLIRAHRELEAAAVIAIEQIPRAETYHSGIVVPAGEATPGTPVRLRDIVEKPSPADAPGTWAVAGRYAFSPVIFAALARTPPDPGGEIQLTDAIRGLIREGRPVYGYPLGPGQRRYDTGSFAGYFQAFAHFARQGSRSFDLM